MDPDGLVRRDLDNSQARLSSPDVDEGFDLETVPPNHLRTGIANLQVERPAGSAARRR